MATQTIEQMLSKALRELSAVRREMREVRELINADVRTADRLVSVKEAGELLGCKKTTIYRMIGSGLLPATRNEHGRFRLSFNQIQKFIHT